MAIPNIRDMAAVIIISEKVSELCFACFGLNAGLCVAIGILLLMQKLFREHMAKGMVA
jgi:hypothetical protein